MILLTKFCSFGSESMSVVDVLPLKIEEGMKVASNT